MKLAAYNLQKLYNLGYTKKVLAVDKVSISLKENETVGLVGEAGSGKTTIAMMLSGLIKPDGGTIFINVDDKQLGKYELSLLSKPDKEFEQKNSITYWSENKLREYRKKVGVVFQESYLYLPAGMTVEEIIKEPLIAEKKDLSKVEEVLSLVGIEDLKDYYPFELSDGQKQKVALARALAYADDILILDEPTSNLDPISKREIIDILKKIKGQKTMLFITHEINIAKEICDKLYIIYKGKIVEEGPANELFKLPRHPYTKQLVAVGSRALEYAGKLFLEEYYPFKISGCVYHRACPLAFNECGWTPDEVLYDIQRLSSFITNKHIEGAVIGWDVIIYGLRKGQILDLIKNHPEIRSFKAIDDIEETSAGLTLKIHKPSMIPSIKMNEAIVRCLLYRGQKIKV